MTELFITLPGSQRPRQTKDIDLVMDVVNLGEYSDILRGQLAALGLRQDMREGAPICRWLFEDIVVDIMPTRGEILGFSSEWYPLAYETATSIKLPNNSIIRLVTPACFLATKLAAFGDRGQTNPIASHDLEDVIAVIDGRLEIVGDVAAAPTKLRNAIANQLEAVISRPDAEDLIAAQLLPDTKSQDRLPLVLNRIRDLIAAAT